MSYPPKKREIYLFDCNTEGRIKDCGRYCHKEKTHHYTLCEKPHYYIIVSSENYNKSSEEILGIPITSKDNFKGCGFELIREYFDKPCKFIGSYALCDRPCRLNIHSLIFIEKEGKITAQEQGELNSNGFIAVINEVKKTMNLL